MIDISVIKEKRSLSELEFYHNALKLDKEINQLLLKDFGIRDKIRELKYFCDIKKLDSKDKEIFFKIVEKYKTVSIFNDLFINERSHKNEICSYHG